MTFAPVGMQVLNIISKEVLLILASIFLIAGVLFIIFKRYKKLGWYSVGMSAILYFLWFYCMLSPSTEERVAEIVGNPIKSFLRESSDSIRIRYEERDPAVMAAVAESVIRLMEENKTDSRNFMYYDRIRKDVEEAASKGYAGAYYVLGLMHSKGLGCPRDHRMAATYLEKCIDLNPDEPAGYLLLQSLDPEVRIDPMVGKKLAQWDIDMESIKKLESSLVNDYFSCQKKILDNIKFLHRADTNSSVFKLIEENRNKLEFLNVLYKDKLSIIIASYYYGIKEYSLCQKYYDKAIKSKSMYGTDVFFKFFPDTNICMDGGDFKEVLLYSSKIQYAFMNASSKEFRDSYLYYAVAQADYSKNKYLYGMDTRDLSDSLVSLRHQLVNTIKPQIKRRSKKERESPDEVQQHREWYFFNMTDTKEWVDRHVYYDNSIIQFDTLHILPFKYDSSRIILTYNELE